MFDLVVQRRLVQRLAVAVLVRRLQLFLHRPGDDVNLPRLNAAIAGSGAGRQLIGA